MRLCECGCGSPTTLARKTNSKAGYTKGQPLRFLNWHRPQGEQALTWQGGRRKTTAGYIQIYMPGHPRATHNRVVFEHVLLAEHALGGPLPPRAVVHHVNGERDDNRNVNLVLCQDTAYHRLLHQRERAYAATGDARSVKCGRCGKWGRTGEGDMRTYSNGRSTHRVCAAEYARIWRRKEAL